MLVDSLSRCVTSSNDLRPWQAHEEKEEMENLRARNMRLVTNILPTHVAEYFLNAQNKEEVSPPHARWRHVRVPRPRSSK